MGPGDAAKLLNIDRSTITRWTAHEFKRYMTSGAQGGTGKQRVVTERDLRVLHLIKMLKDTNTPPEEIHATLQQMERVDWEGLPDMPAAPRNMANVPVVPTAAADAALSAERKSLLREITFLQDRIEQLEQSLTSERVKTVEKQEELLRELADLRQRIGEQEVELKLYRSGRLKPDSPSE